MVYKYLGYGVTDSNGVAKLDHDAEGQELQHSYTGVGAGEVDVVASLDNPVSSGSIVSETLPVYDAWMRDGGVTGDVNNDDWLVQIGGSRTVGSDGTVFSGDTGSLFAWINKHGTTHSGLTDIAEYSGDYGIELTVVEVNGSAKCSIYEAYPSSKRVDIPLSVGKWRITRINNVVTAYKDGTLTPITSLNLNAPQRIGIIASQGDSVKIKDVAVYGLGGTELGLTANKQIIESGETTTLSAYLSEGSGNTVQLYNADTDTLIDTMTDVGNGQYTYTVTGTGSGQKRYYAKYGSVVSEPYSVCDAVFYDKALSGTGNHNDNWTSIANFTRGESSTSFSPSGSYSNSRIKINDSTDIAMGTYAIEVTISDVSKGTGDLRIGINDGSSRNISLQNGNYLIEMKDDGKIYISVNGTAQTPINYDNTANTFTVGFYNTSDSSASFKFRDFRIYPI